MPNIEWYQLYTILALLTAVASAYTAHKANKISSSVRNFQEKIFLNEDEIKISQEILEKLTLYNIWCNDHSQIGSLGINYNNNQSENYDNRDDIFTSTPNEVKVLCVKLQSRGEHWRKKVAQWEDGFLLGSNNKYSFKEEYLEEKILQFKKFRAELLYYETIAK